MRKEQNKIPKWVQAYAAACLTGIVAYLVGLMLSWIFPQALLHTLRGLGVFGVVVIAARLTEFLRS
jgi:hypothetical protein